MDNYELPCQLCQVPFKIGRFRTAFEPRCAALSRSRDLWPEEGRCRQYGCKTAPLRGDPAKNSSKSSDETAIEVFDDVAFSEFSAGEDSISLAPSKPEWSIEWQAYHGFVGEHVAEPHCEDTQGYNGNHILAEEMRLCTTVQCLVAKENHTRDWLTDWAPEPDYEDFEAESDYFLSGLGDRIDDDDETNGSPIRHRIADLDLVLAHLSSRDIANLRLVSRAFYHLPITLWHDLMQKEMPWIWEAWTDRAYPGLTCTTRNELDAIDEMLKSQVWALEALYGDQRAAIEQANCERNKRYAELLEPWPVRQLDRLRTDWYWLYCRINGEWENIKGLQNRERIWKTLEFVVRRVDRPEEDVGAVVEEHKTSFPFGSERFETQP